jgi:hypothetical protein
LKRVGATRGSRIVRQRPHANAFVAAQTNTQQACNGYVERRIDVDRQPRRAAGENDPTAQAKAHGTDT